MASNLCPPDFDGGQEVRAFQVASALRDAGHSVELVSSGYRDSFTGVRSDPPWVHRILKYVEKGESGISKVARYLAAQHEGVKNHGRLQSWLAGKDFDVAYLFGLHRVGLATHCALVKSSIPILWHCGDDFLVKQLVARPRESVGFRLILATLLRTSRRMEQHGDYRNLAFNSKSLRDSFVSLGMPIQNEWIIPRSVDFELRADIHRSRAARFFIATRIHEQKGVHVAIAAARLLLEKAPELGWKLEIVGKVEHPGYGAKLEAMIDRGGLMGRVEIIGQLPRQEVLDRMANSIAVLQTSVYEEPMGNTIIEALGIGTPVIASDVGAAREMIEDGVSGIVVRPDDPTALAEAMRRLLTDRSFADKLALGGLDVARQRFSLASVLARTEAALSQVAAQRGGP